MTREELMINDIVFDYTNSPVKVCAVGQDIVVKNVFGVGVLDPNELNPIPLTEEILVKNGWRKEPITIDGDYANWHGEIPTSQAEDEYNYADIELRYVHTLQHLLRLCGIEKELVID